MKFIIRNAEPKDLNSITEIYQTKNDYPLSPFGKEKKEIFVNMAEDKSRCILVGEKNGKICAFLSMKIENRLQNFFKNSAMILDIKATDDESEILCAVLSRAIATAMENECCEISILDKCVTNKTNSVYSICGFSESNSYYIKKL